MKYERLGIIGRFRPLHLGGAKLLDDLCSQAEHVVIGVGSSNRYNFRCPFKPEEVHEMIDAYLGPRHSNYEVVYVRDFGHIDSFSDGQRWKQEVEEQLGKLDGFVTGNPWTSTLLKETYPIISLGEVLEHDRYAHIHGTPTRVLMAGERDWEQYVPTEVVRVIKERGWDKRLVDRFGERILEHGSAAETSIEIERANIGLGEK